MVPDWFWTFLLHNLDWFVKLLLNLKSKLIFLGYMNSFMNPVIYTIFNAEFRRAFKSLLLGRRPANIMRRI